MRITICQLRQFLIDSWHNVQKIYWTNRQFQTWGQQFYPELGFGLKLGMHYELVRHSFRVFGPVVALVLSKQWPQDIINLVYAFQGLWPSHLVVRPPGVGWERAFIDNLHNLAQRLNVPYHYKRLTRLVKYSSKLGSLDLCRRAYWISCPKNRHREYIEKSYTRSAQPIDLTPLTKIIDFEEYQTVFRYKWRHQTFENLPRVWQRRLQKCWDRIIEGSDLLSIFGKSQIESYWDCDIFRHRLQDRTLFALPILEYGNPMYIGGYWGAVSILDYHTLLDLAKVLTLEEYTDYILYSTIQSR